MPADSVAVLRAMLPCPFCGEVPTIDNIRADENQGTKWGSVVCSCGIVGPEVRTGYAPVAEWADSAAERWNERAPGGVGDAVTEAQLNRLSGPESLVNHAPDALAGDGVTEDCNHEWTMACLRCGALSPMENADA